MQKYKAVQLLDLVAKIGEEKVKALLSDFSSPLNPKIEDFLKNKALEFSRRKSSITHLVMDEEAYLVGFFTLALKPLQVNNNRVSRTTTKRLGCFGRYDSSTDSYELAAYLIAQFGKNYQFSKERQIDGVSLMNLSIKRLLEVQHVIGGGAVFLECEEQEKLLSFYQKEENRYRIFGERKDDDHSTLIQLIRFIG